MRDYAKVSPRFWVGETGRAIRALGPECQVVALYLITSPHANMLGLYYLPLPFLAYETGLSLEGASEALRSLSEAGFCQYDEASEHVWVVEMARFQIGERLSQNDNQVKGVRRELANLSKTALVQAFTEKYAAAFHLEIESPSEAPSEPLRSQEQEQEQEQERAPRKRGTRVPDDFEIDDGLREWARKNAPGIDLRAETEQFLDYHRGKGSVQKDWRATWRTWMRKAVEFSKGRGGAAPAGLSLAERRKL